MAEYINGLPVYTDRDIGARVYNSANISIPNSTTTALTFNSENYDTDGIHSTVSNTSRLTCQTAGKYIIHGQVEFASNSTGTRQLIIDFNNGAYIGVSQPSSISTVVGRYEVTTIYDLGVGDYVELKVSQTSGDALNVIAQVWSPVFWMQRLG